MAKKKRRGRRAAFGRIFRRQGRPGLYLRIRLGDREVERYADPDRATAEALRAELLRKWRREKLLGEKVIASVTFREFQPKLLLHFEARHAPSTLAAERGRLDRIVKWFGSTPMKDIDEAAVLDFLTSLRMEDKLSQTTTNRYSSLLSVAFRYAITKGYARHNPIRDVPRPREQKRPVPYVSGDDVARLVAESRDARFGAMIRVLADTGLRRGEALDLEWRDVHVARGVIVVRRSKNRGTREVPLTEAASAALRQLEAERPPLPMSGPDLVWPEWSDKRPQAVSSRFKTVAKRAGMESMRLHDLRHAFCSRLAQASVPLSTIAELAGHEAVTTTQRYASHLPHGAGQDAIRALQRSERVAAARRPRKDANGAG